MATTKKRYKLSRFKKWLHKHDGGDVQPVRTGKNVQFENRLFFPLIVEEINNGHTVTINLRGNSMRPFLESDRDRALLTNPKGVKLGDPVLAEIEPGHFVLHRIIKIDGDAVTLMGLYYSEAKGTFRVGSQRGAAEEAEALGARLARRLRDEEERG